MQRFWGHRGSKLRLAIWIETGFGVTTFGYNMGAAGAVLNNSAFYGQFPQMNTSTTVGIQKQHNSTIQGKLLLLWRTVCVSILTHLKRDRCCSLRTLWNVWVRGLYLSW